MRILIDILLTEGKRTSVSILQLKVLVWVFG